MQSRSEGHASGQPEDGSGEVDGLVHRFEDHEAGFSCVAASISQVQSRVLRFFVCGQMGVGWVLQGGAEPLMVRVVENEGRA